MAKVIDLPDTLKFDRVRYLDDEFWHWQYQFRVNDDWFYDNRNQEILWRWMLENMENIGGWHIRHWGVIIYSETDAMIFKLRFQGEKNE